MNTSNKKTSKSKKTDTLKSIRDIEEFEDLVMLAKGSFSTVYHGYCDGVEYAIKVIHTENDISDELKIGELAKGNKHMNTVVPAIHHVFVDGGEKHVVMDFVQGKILNTVIRSADHHVRIAVCLILVRQLEKLHDLGIVHLDIKPNNIIYDKKSRELRFVDYGFACIKPEDLSDTDVPCLVTMKGSPDFMSPELYLINYHKTPKIVNAWIFATGNDIWALAITMTLILNGGFSPYKRRHRPVTRTGERLSPLQHRTKHRQTNKLLDWIENTVFLDSGHQGRISAAKFADQFDAQIGQHVPAKRRKRTKIT